MKIIEILAKSLYEEVAGGAILSTTDQSPDLPSANRTADRPTERIDMDGSMTRPTPMLSTTILPRIRAMKEYDIPDEELERIEHDKEARPNRAILRAKYVEPGAPPSQDAY